MSNILIIGATSAIAEAVARLWAKQNHSLYLLARNTEQLSIIAQDLKIVGAPNVWHASFDVNKIEDHQKILDQAFLETQGIDIVLIAHGTLPNQAECEQDITVMLKEITTNAISTLSLLTLLANRLEQQKAGTIAVITSVAGDRGRQSNYVYGAAKAMVSRFLEGLRNRLYQHQVHVLDIRPGFVDTPMTAEFKKGALWATPNQVAQDIIKAIQTKKNTLYTPFFWRYILLIIRHIPEVIFKRLKL
jgi:decaprenylphospho-beta-D-erythro-pentofuranosid-2-ulose 2-reductase